MVSLDASDIRVAFMVAGPIHSLSHFSQCTSTRPLASSVLLMWTLMEWWWWRHLGQLPDMGSVQWPGGKGLPLPVVEDEFRLEILASAVASRISFSNEDGIGSSPRPTPTPAIAAI